MSNMNQITNAGTLKLQRAAAELQVQARIQNKNISAEKKDAQFSELLNQKAQQSPGVQFSKHAALRVQERGIEMTESLMNDLNMAVERARVKGAKDVVVIGEDGAFIVNVPNKVVVTTMNETEMKENIFTNIDSAVLM